MKQNRDFYHFLANKNWLQGAMLVLVCLCFTGCGNADRGIQLRTPAPPSKSNASLQSGPASVAAAETCSSLIVFPGQDSSQVASLQGTSACVQSSGADLIKIKASSNFNLGLRYCVIATYGSQVASVACASYSQRETLTRLSSANFTHIAFVLEADLNAYLSYLYGYTEAYPTVLFGQIR